MNTPNLFFVAKLDVGLLLSGLGVAVMWHVFKGILNRATIHYHPVTAELFLVFDPFHSSVAMCLRKRQGFFYRYLMVGVNLKFYQVDMVYNVPNFVLSSLALCSHNKFC